MPYKFKLSWSEFVVTWFDQLSNVKTLENGIQNIGWNKILKVLNIDMIIYLHLLTNYIKLGIIFNKNEIIYPKRYIYIFSTILHP